MKTNRAAVDFFYRMNKRHDIYTLNIHDFEQPSNASMFVSFSIDSELYTDGIKINTKTNVMVYEFTFIIEEVQHRFNGATQTYYTLHLNSKINSFEKASQMIANYFAPSMPENEKYDAYN